MEAPLSGTGCQDDGFSWSRSKEINSHLYNNTLRELRKILEIEGLLDKYGYVFKDKVRNKRNYYPGILALRSRLNAEKNAAKEKVMLESSMNKMFEGRNSKVSVYIEL